MIGVRLLSEARPEIKEERLNQRERPGAGLLFAQHHAPHTHSHVLEKLSFTPPLNISPTVAEVKELRTLINARVLFTHLVTEQ